MLAVFHFDSIFVLFIFWQVPVWDRVATHRGVIHRVAIPRGVIHRVEQENLLVRLVHN